MAYEPSRIGARPRTRVVSARSICPRHESPARGTLLARSASRRMGSAPAHTSIRRDAVRRLGRAPSERAPREAARDRQGPGGPVAAPNEGLLRPRADDRDPDARGRGASGRQARDRRELAAAERRAARGPVALRGESAGEPARRAAVRRARRPPPNTLSQRRRGSRAPLRPPRSPRVVHVEPLIGRLGLRPAEARPEDVDRSAHLR